LRLRVNRELWRKDPSHAELPPLTHGHRLASNREAVGERGWPDVHIHAAVELVDRLAIPVLPMALTIRMQVQ
jgi:hypothetical protein